MALPSGIALGHYRLLRMLGQGGFGITYLAVDQRTNAQVVIKENLPTFYAVRDDASMYVRPLAVEDAVENYAHTLQRFVDEARILARLNHPNIVHVHEAFEALGSAYYVMPYIEAKELHKAAPAVVDEAWLLPILKAVLGALEYLHAQNLLHRDLKPGNILLQEDGTPILIDFGTARALQTERSATMVGTPGYTPIEQITTRGKRGPWTDIYALGATCYRIITGQLPPEANARLAEEVDPYRPLANREELFGRFSTSLLSSIDTALAVRAKDRWQSAQSWLDELENRAPRLPEIQLVSESVVLAEDPVAIPETILPADITPPKRSPLSLILALLAVVLLGGGGYGVYAYLDAAEQARLQVEYELAEAKREAQKQAERLKREAEEARLAQEEDELKVREEAERLKREEEARLAREEAERKAREAESLKAANEKNLAQKVWCDFCIASFAEGKKYSGEWIRDGRFGELTLKIDKAIVFENTIQFYGALYDTNLPQASISISGRCSMNREENGTSQVVVTLYDGAYDPDEPTAEVYDAADGRLILEFSEHGELKGIMTRASWTETTERNFTIHLGSCEKSGKSDKEKTVAQKKWMDLCVASFAEGSKFCGEWSRDGRFGELTLKINRATVYENSIHFYGELYDTKLPKACISFSGRCSKNREENGTSQVVVTLYDGAYDPDEPTAEVYDAADGRLILEFSEHGKLKGIMTCASWTETPERNFSVRLAIQKKN